MINKFIFQGRFTADPTKRYSPSTKREISAFSLANQGSKKDSVMYMDCSAYGPLAEFINSRCYKGMQVVVVGSLTIDAVKKNGYLQKYYRIDVHELHPCDKLGDPKTKSNAEAASSVTATEKDTKGKAKSSSSDDDFFRTVPTQNDIVDAYARDFSTDDDLPF